MSSMPSTSSGVSATVSTETVVEIEEPPKKRTKNLKESMILDSAISSPSSSSCTVSEKLENRLGGILCCTVCLDLPKAAVFQCPNGHLMCAACFTHILADSRIRDESSSCPNCRTDISKTNATRNLAVEKAISELPSKCQFCAKKFPRNTLSRHEESQCEDRKSKCKYYRIGCLWIGPEHERLQHETQCIHPKNTGDKIMEALEVIDLKFEEERRSFNTVLELLSYEKLIFIDFQLKPYRTDEFIHRLFFESSRFSAFNHQWVVKARISETQRDPAQCTERDISYQLILRSKCSSSFTLHFLVLPGPIADLKLRTHVSKHEFNEPKNESPHFPLPLDGFNECNRFLSMKTIDLRILMFMAPK